MTEEQLREETRRRIAEDDRELAQDEAEVTRRMSKTLEEWITESDVVRAHYAESAKEAVEDHKREEYRDKAATANDLADELRELEKKRKAKATA